MGQDAVGFSLTLCLDGTFCSKHCFEVYLTMLPRLVSKPVSSSDPRDKMMGSVFVPSCSFLVPPSPEWPCSARQAVCCPAGELHPLEGRVGSHSSSWPSPPV